MLVGTAYWSGLIDWLRDTVLADGNDLARTTSTALVVTDDVDEAVALMVAAPGR